MKKQEYPLLDIMKFISACFVVAIHCAPWIQLNETANLLYVQGLGRLAVPFFFLASGFLFFRQIDLEKGWKDPQNLGKLQHYLKRILILYLVWSVLYLPVLIVQWIQGGFTLVTLLRFIRDIVWTGTYYHLWFLPALMIGMVFVYGLRMKFSQRTVLYLTFLLYVLGACFNVYADAWSMLPVCNTIYHWHESVFVTARNGLLFAPIFLYLGIYVKDFMQKDYRKPLLFCIICSFIAYAGEFFLIVQLGWMKDLTSMYITLVPCVFFLFLWIMQFSMEGNELTKALRPISLLMYVSHLFFILIFLQYLQLPNHIAYLATLLGSFLFSCLVLQLEKRWHILRYLH